MSKHTTGNWRMSNPVQFQNHVEINIQQDSDICPAIICKVIGSTNPMMDSFVGASELLGNAARIAAVNDLHDALEGMVTLLEIHAPPIWRKREEYAAACAALAKARGE